MPPTTMTAIVQGIYGGPEVLHFATVPTPQLRPHDLLIRVAAISVNPVDAKRRSGGPAGGAVANPPQIIGWDCSGVVEAVGAAVTLFQPGDEVYCAGDITRPGCYAEYVAVDERIVGHKPRTLSHEQAAAIPLTALTAWEGMIETLQITRGNGIYPNTILIVGGAGGVGSIALQIARRVCGLQVIATASRPESAELCRALGADVVLDHSQELAPQMERLGLTPVPYIFSSAALRNFEQLVAVLAPFGHICLILAGPEAQALNVSGLMPIRGSVSWELMFTRPRVGVEMEKQGQILNRVADLLDQSVLTTTAREIMSWREVHDAHRRIESVHTMGKIVLRVE